MKNVYWLSGTEQEAFLMNCWKTPFFQEKAKSDPWLNAILRRLMKRPHALAQASHANERHHFATFWNVWIFNEYASDYIHDLGVLHELLHTILFDKKRQWGSTKESWMTYPLATMETAVSLRTEVMVYKRRPELRQHTFTQKNLG